MKTPRLPSTNDTWTPARRIGLTLAAALALIANGALPALAADSTATPEARSSGEPAEPESEPRF